jgi:sulfoxide reductase heme-binding subunit YedZ
MVLLEWLKTRWLRVLVHFGALLPLTWLAWQFAWDAFKVDPVRETTTLTGKAALILLLLALACTPLSTLFGFKRALRVRRALGLYAFLYTSLHFLTFVGLDYGFDVGLLRQAVLEQRYVLAGLAAGLLLLPLAITSSRGWQKRLGKNWKALQRLVYLAGVLAIVHFVWLVKDYREPLRYGVVLAVLLVLRIPPVRRAGSRVRRRIKLGQGRQARSDATT